MNTNMFFLLVVVLAAVIPSGTVALATSDNNEDSSSKGSVCDETVAKLTGVSFDRLNEVSDHLDDNKESLGFITTSFLYHSHMRRFTQGISYKF